MKIPEYSPSNVETTKEAASLQRLQTDDPSATDVQGDIGSVDSTGLSSLSRVLTQARENDANRVEELRRQVANGSYAVDSAALAKKLVDSMSEE